MANDQSREDLSREVTPETVAIGEQLRPLLTPAKGFVAVLDALGTKLLTLESARHFVETRNLVVGFATKVVEDKLPGFETMRRGTFLLNDTLVFTYAPATIDLSELERFCHWLRVFEAYAIMKT